MENKNITGRTLDTESIDVLVEKSLAKTADVDKPVKTTQVINTESIELPVSQSVQLMQNKETVLNGGITKSASISIGGDNIVYGNVRLSAIDNAVKLNDDGLYVKPNNWQANTDGNINIVIDNNEQNVEISVENSPKLNNKYENELNVQSALNYTQGGTIEQAVNSKVDKVLNKGLSECDFTAVHKAAVEGIANIDYSEIVKYDANAQKLTIGSEKANKEISLKSLLTNATYNAATGRLTFNVANGNPINIDIPKDNFVSQGSYNVETQEIVLTLNNGALVKIPAADMVPVYKGTSGDIIDITIDSSKNISAGLKLSSESNNALVAKDDGLYVATVNKTSLNIENVDNTSDIAKPISEPQKEYVNKSMDNLEQAFKDRFMMKQNEGDIIFKSADGKISFFINGLAQMEISSEGVNFLV